MLNSLKIDGFKSIREQSIEFPELTVLFGPNATGKSNIIDAIQAISRIGTQRTIADALTAPIRGYPVEAFSFPPSGLPGLLQEETATFTLTADVSSGGERFEYQIGISIVPKTGALSVESERLSTLNPKQGTPKGQPRIEPEGEHLLLRSRSRPGRPRHEPLSANHTCLSDPRLGGQEYGAIEKCRAEFNGWRTYYLDPRVAMREASPPSEVHDIGALGDTIAPFLFRLYNESPKHFNAINRTVRQIIPGVESVSVDLDERRGTLEIWVRQDGVDYSSRIISEGTLRVIALCSIAVNPWGGSLVAFEEPENGVHPRRIELVAKLLTTLAGRSKQIIVTTHSPLFCGAVLKEAREANKSASLLSVKSDDRGSRVSRFEPSGELFKDQEILDQLSSPSEEAAFEGLMLRGLVNA
jgi:predicted ATPase